MARRTLLRASDAEREQVAERLREATGEGRLLPEELEERLGLALTARTQGELHALVADLPGPRAASRRAMHLSPLSAFALALAAAMLAVILVIAVALLLTGVFVFWGVWIVWGWWFFGRRRRPYSGQRRTYGARLY